MTGYTTAMTQTMDHDTAVSDLVRAAEADGILITHEEAEKINLGDLDINDVEQMQDDTQPEDLDYGFITEGDEQFYCDVILSHAHGEHINCYPEHLTCGE